MFLPVLKLTARESDEMSGCTTPVALRGEHCGVHPLQYPAGSGVSLLRVRNKIPSHAKSVRACATGHLLEQHRRRGIPVFSGTRRGNRQPRSLGGGVDYFDECQRASCLRERDGTLLYTAT
jgi:hypothetical protein